MRKWLVGSLIALALLAFSSDAQAQKGRSFSSGSGRSFSSGSSSSSFGRSSSFSSKPSFSSSSKPSVAAPSPKVSTPAGRSFSTGTPSARPSAPAQPKFSTGPPKTGPPVGNSAKPSSSGWNPGLSGSAQKSQSKTNFQAATRPAETPKPTFKTSTGQEKSLKADAPQVQTVRRYVTHERYVTYDHRSSVFYGPTIYAHPQPYNDWFSPFLMGYLFSSAVNANERAMWVYSHRHDMDEARYRAMVAKDAELEARLRELERQKVARDPNYVVPAMKDNPDVQYNKDFVTAAYNPQSVPPPPSSGGSGVGTFFFWFFVIVLAGAVLALLIYLFFIKEW